MNDPSPPDYEAIEADAWTSNALDVRDRLLNNDKFLNRRIATFVARFGYETAQVREKILTDQMFAATFTKEPRRQGIHENSAAQWLNQLPSVQGFERLPQGGSRAWCVSVDGGIRMARDNPDTASKALDFKWITGETTFWAMHKYTRESGGNQDSQFREMKDLLRNYMQHWRRTDALLVIVDGPYYNQSRMAELKFLERKQSPKSFATPIAAVPSILRSYS